MEVERSPFQGVLNILRFNWHIYVYTAGSIALALSLGYLYGGNTQTLMIISSSLGVLSILISFIVSYFIYDHSNLYQLPWLTSVKAESILNIHSGFDETSALIQVKIPNSSLTVADFYDPKKHTELSIKRARKAYPPYDGTIKVEPHALPFENSSFDLSLCILAAHEIRKKPERIAFFKELKRVTKKDGQIMITEHPSDLPNFLAYTVGAFHFHSRKLWLRTFEKAGLRILEEQKTTPFISTFILVHHEDTY